MQNGKQLFYSVFFNHFVRKQDYVQNNYHWPGPVPRSDALPTYSGGRELDPPVLVAFQFPKMFLQATHCFHSFIVPMMNVNLFHQQITSVSFSFLFQFFKLR